jgi:hypothetical protein
VFNGEKCMETSTISALRVVSKLHEIGDTLVIMTLIIMMIITMLG